MNEATASASSESRSTLPSSSAESSSYGPTFWVSLVVGWSVIGWALHGLVGDELLPEPWRVGRLVLITIIAHDFVLAPIVVLVGIVLTRVVPRWLRGAVRGAAALSAVVVLFSYPLLRGFGRSELNPSRLPLDYGRNVALIVASIWLVALAIAVIRRQRTVT